VSKHLEIERKFLVKKLPGGWRKQPHSKIIQGYFPMGSRRIELRLRRKGARHFLTIKAGRGETRLEEEIALKKDTFDSLWPLTNGKRVSKKRYRIPCDRRTIELDVYEGPHRGLVTADVEFGSQRELESFRIPDWFGRELTGNMRYTNESLAKRQALP